MRNRSTVFGRRSGWHPIHTGGDLHGTHRFLAGMASPRLKLTFEAWSRSGTTPPPPLPKQPRRRSSHPAVILREPRHHLTSTAIRRIVGDGLGQRCPAATATNSMAGRCHAFRPGTQRLAGWDSPFPQPRSYVAMAFSFSITLTPSFPPTPGDSPLPRQRPFAGPGVGHQEVVWHKHHEHHDFFLATQHTEPFHFPFIFPFFPLGSLAR